MMLIYWDFKRLQLTLQNSEFCISKANLDNYYNNNRDFLFTQYKIYYKNISKSSLIYQIKYVQK